MPLTVESRLEDDIAILELAGSFTLGPALASFRTATQNLLGSAKLRGIVLVISGLTAVDSSGLGEFTFLYTSASRRGCALCIVGPNQLLRGMLEITRLDALLPEAPDLETAKNQLRARSNSKAARA